MKLKKLICIATISVLGVLSFAGCAKKQDAKKTETSSEASTQEASAQIFAMDTYMNLKAYGKNAQKAVDDAKSEIERLDQLWSAVDKNSEIYQLNQKKKMKVSDETLELIEFAKKAILREPGSEELMKQIHSYYMDRERQKIRVPFYTKAYIRMHEKFPKTADFLREVVFRRFTVATARKNSEI